MKPLRSSVCFFFAFLLVFSAHADLTIVQKIEGTGQVTEMTVKIKGDKARIDATPQMTTIIDAKTGEMVQLMKDRKSVVRISGEKMKAAMETLSKFNDSAGTASQPKLTPTGQRETINGYETEQYVFETPMFKATYWVAPTYPNSAAILKQLQVMNSNAWQVKSMAAPNYSDFPGVPLKSTVAVKGSEITTSLVSIKEGALDDSEFAIPKDFQEVKAPEMLLGSPPPGKGASDPAKP